MAPTGYRGYAGLSPQQTAMQMASNRMKEGEHYAADQFVQTVAPLVACESMDLSNDPRFFTGNVIDKRLAAFSGLAVVSGLMVGSTLSECFGMKKAIFLDTPDGVFQAISFLLMNIVLFANMFAMYVSVAQIYFTYRLMTAGPMGFEMASSFYLNANVAFWRHAAVKKMLISLPVFLLASAFRILVKFDEGIPDPENPDGTTTPVPLVTPWWLRRVFGANILGLLTCAGWFSISFLLFYVNSKHQAVFKERYTHARDMEQPLMAQVSLMSNRGMSPEV